MQLICSNGRRPAAAILLSVFAFGGCSGDATTPSDTLTRAAVWGTVTLDGAPLSQGTIQFNPEEGTEGPVVPGDISAGKFSIERSLGPVPGKYKVTISSRPSATIKPGESPGEAPKLAPETVPGQYNTKTTLTKDVTAAGPNQFDFPLVTK